MRTTLFLLAAAGSLLVAAPAAHAECVDAGDVALVCAGVDTERRCVWSSGHVDVYTYRIACSPR